MSRDDAASVYLKRLLGFRTDYALFCSATDRLSEEEKMLLQSAVSGWLRDDRLMRE